MYELSSTETTEGIEFNHTLGLYEETLGEVDSQEVARAMGDFNQWEAQGVVFKSQAEERH